jgi:lysozyme
MRSGWADQSGAVVRAVFLAAFVLGALLAGGGVVRAVVEDLSLPDPGPSAQIEAGIEAGLVPVMADPRARSLPASGGLASDQEFLAIAVPFVARWEGLRLEAYRDIVGIWTVCFGETKGVRPGDRYTRAECEAMLAREILDYRRGLHVYFLPQTKAALLPAARDLAFVSLAYNAGIAGAGKSTAARRLNAGQVAAACEALTWWNKAGGKVVRGLVRRRADEYGLCMRGVA